MTTKTLAELARDEQDIFAAVCAEHGLETVQFLVYVEELYPVVGGGCIERQAYVQRLSNQVARIYPAGSGTSWIMIFSGDLVDGEFD
ncbi:hypothetical protein [Collimonas sp.]|uniref:hypothetical protein n=1 Tax=Collimonas sp. TaxID=1963772 RepID=UPI002BD1174F|nr:hypothetical protein [Collimonas sp.]HWW06795.1 hypothetical protein [Collimonas sp.]